VRNQESNKAVVALSVIRKLHEWSENLFMAAYVMRSKAVIVEVLKRPLSNKRQMPKCIQKKQVLPIEKSRDEVVIVKCASIAPNASNNSRALRGESQRSNLTISLTHSFSPRHSSVQCSSELLNSPLLFEVAPKYR
jgi:hypothetical protein